MRLSLPFSPVIRHVADYRIEIPIGLS